MLRDACCRDPGAGCTPATRSPSPLRMEPSDTSCRPPSASQRLMAGRMNRRDTYTVRSPIFIAPCGPLSNDNLYVVLSYYFILADAMEVREPRNSTRAPRSEPDSGSPISTSLLVLRSSRWGLTSSYEPGTTIRSRFPIIAGLTWLSYRLLCATGHVIGRLLYLGPGGCKLGAVRQRTRATGAVFRTLLYLWGAASWVLLPVRVLPRRRRRSCVCTCWRSMSRAPRYGAWSWPWRSSMFG